MAITMALPKDYSPYSSQAVANVFLDLCKDEGITNMQVQKLVYIAHGYHTAILKEPLYYHNTHAWQFGPVILKLYKDLQQYGNGQVKDKLQCDDIILQGSESYNVIQAVWNKYKGMTGGQLSKLTHLSGTPWDKTWERDKFGIIPIKIINHHYRSKIDRAKQDR